MAQPAPRRRAAGVPSSAAEREVSGALRDHRRGHVGHPRRDQAAGSRLRRLRALREGRPPRRHVAREHVPGHRVRRAVAPLQLLLRAQPGVEPPLLARRRDPGATSRASRSGTACDARIRYGEEVTRCAFEDGRWHLETTSGRRDEADVVIAATGVLHHPKLPDIAGLDTLRGRAASTARAGTTTCRSTGRRVGIVGTGSTAVQIVSALVDEVAKLSLFQRTRAVDHAAGEPGVHRRARRPSSGSDPERCGAPRELSQLFAEGFANAVVDADSPQMQADPGRLPREPREQRGGSRAAREAPPELPRGVQAPDHLARLLRRPSSGRTPSS